MVALARRNPDVSEVIVVDDGSIDGSPELARRAGAAVMTSTLLGKGASMQVGVRVARNETLLFLDGDLSLLREDLVRCMTEPILSSRADFVKARFSRTGGRVTALTARPLLRHFFPELSWPQQPLGGIVASRRSLLRDMHFVTDYGVDVGLLLDVVAAGARLVEVEVGYLEHASQPLECLDDMATQVARVILRRAARAGRLCLDQLREVEENERVANADLSVILERVRPADRIALFDMDGVLLDGRFIVSLARETGREAALAGLLDNEALSPESRTHAIGSLFSGVPRAVFENTARRVPLMRGASEVVIDLRKAGYRVGLVTESFRIASEVVRRRVFANFSVAHLLNFRRGQATGEVILCPAMIHPSGCPRHACCKANVLVHLLDRLGIETNQVLAVGDGENDICLLHGAGRSVAFRPRTPAVEAAAEHTVRASLYEIMPIVYRNKKL